MIPGRGIDEAGLPARTPSGPKPTIHSVAGFHGAGGEVAPVRIGLPAQPHILAFDHRIVDENARWWLTRSLEIQDVDACSARPHVDPILQREDRPKMQAAQTGIVAKGGPDPVLIAGKPTRGGDPQFATGIHAEVPDLPVHQTVSRSEISRPTLLVDEPQPPAVLMPEPHPVVGVDR